MNALPEHGMCFVCGSENAHNMGITWYAKEDGSIYTKITLTEFQQGPPGHAHGGATAAILDEAMGAAVWFSGRPVLAANLSVDYLKPVPLGVPLEVHAHITQEEGQTIYTKGQILLPDGEIAVVGTGTYVQKPTFFSGFMSEEN
jgi:uncharacterized protein (TIGR00369 family)